MRKMNKICELVERLPRRGAGERSKGEEQRRRPEERGREDRQGELRAKKIAESQADN